MTAVRGPVMRRQRRFSSGTGHGRDRPCSAASSVTSGHAQPRSFQLHQGHSRTFRDARALSSSGPADPAPGPLPLLECQVLCKVQPGWAPPGAQRAALGLSLRFRSFKTLWILFPLRFLISSYR